MLVRACLSLVVVISLTAQSWLSAADLVFSEYVEGSGYNKALEIFNSSEESVDLTVAGYAVAVASNGSASFDSGDTVVLVGVIGPGAVFVVANSREEVAQAIKDVADQTSGKISMNGDDTVLLLRGAEIVDSIGQLGVDPGEAWSSGDVSTQDQTLRRLQPLTSDADPSDAFDPSLQWAATAKDDFSQLGMPPQVAVSAQAVAHDRIALEWEAVPGASGYRVFRRLASGGDYALLTEVSAAVSAWLDDSCEPQTAYEYRVWALHD